MKNTSKTLLHFFSKKLLFFSLLSIAFCARVNGQDFNLPYLYVDENSGLYGFKNSETDSIIVPAKYTLARPFSYKLAAVYMGGKLEEDAFSEIEFCTGCKCGFIDKTGKVAIPLTFDDVESYEYGLAAACQNGKHGFIDTLGKVAIPFTYKEVNSFSDGLALVCKDYTNRKYGFIDKAGNTVIDFIYDLGTNSFSDGLAIVHKDEKYGCIDKSGKIAIPIVYNYMKPDGNLLTVSIDQKFGCINKKGEVIIPLDYDNFYSFEGDVVKVEKNGETFYINKKGEKVDAPVNEISSSYDDY